VNKQKASVLYYSIASGYLLAWLIVPNKGKFILKFIIIHKIIFLLFYQLGVVKFHETLIQIENSIDNLLTQYVKEVKNTLNVQQPM